METRFGLEASCRGHGFWDYARTMVEPRLLVFINRGLAGPWESCPNNTKKNRLFFFFRFFIFLFQYVTFLTTFFIVIISNKEKYIQ